MRLLPYERLTFNIGSTPEVVSARLAAVVAVRWFYLKKPPQPFHGVIRGTHFKLVCMPGPFTRNSFRPVVIGDIVPAPNGTEVRVRMRLQAAVAAFMTVWFGGLLIGAGALVRQAMTHGFCHDLGGKSGAGVGGALAGIGGMALLGYLLMSAGFWSEVKKVRVLLREQIGNDAAAK